MRYEEGEKSSSYFFNVERSNGTSKMLNSIKTSDVVSHKDTNTILKEQVAFTARCLHPKGGTQNVQKHC
jgi:hypothetical protein